MSWVVIDRNGAYESWVATCRPSVDEEAIMLVWFDYLEESDDEPTVDGYTDDGVTLLTGPNGEIVEVAIRHNPDWPAEEPRGYIGLGPIGCRQPPIRGR